MKKLFCQLWDSGEVWMFPFVVIGAVTIALCLLNIRISKMPQYPMECRCHGPLVESDPSDTNHFPRVYMVYPDATNYIFDEGRVFEKNRQSGAWRRWMSGGGR